MAELKDGGKESAGGASQGGLPPIIEHHTEFTVWILNKVRKFDRDLRFSIGQALARKSIDTGDLLIEAYYETDRRRREDAMRRASISQEQLRFLIRICHGMRLISGGALHHATERLMIEGKMLGGWIKAQRTGGGRTEL